MASTPPAPPEPGPNVQSVQPAQSDARRGVRFLALTTGCQDGEPPATRTPTLTGGDGGRHAVGRTDRLSGDRVAAVAIPQPHRAAVSTPRPIARWVSRSTPTATLSCGHRLPYIAVPLAPRHGWNEYTPPYPTGELADRDGTTLLRAREDSSATQSAPATSPRCVTAIEQLKTTAPPQSTPTLHLSARKKKTRRRLTKE